MFALFAYLQDAAEKFPVSYEVVSEGICASYDDDTLSEDTGYKTYKTQSVYVLISIKISWKLVAASLRMFIDFIWFGIWIMLMRTTEHNYEHSNEMTGAKWIY